MADDRYAFIAEWYDPNATIIKRFQFLYYVGDSSVEMVSTHDMIHAVNYISVQIFGNPVVRDNSILRRTTCIRS